MITCDIGIDLFYRFFNPLDLGEHHCLTLIVARTGVTRENYLGIQRVNVLLSGNDFKADVLQLNAQLLTLFSKLCAVSRYGIYAILDLSDLNIKLRKLCLCVLLTLF